MAGIGWKWPECLKMAGLAGNEWLEIAGSGWNWLAVGGIAGNGLKGPAKNWK